MESELDRKEEIVEESQEGGQTQNLLSGTFDGEATLIQKTTTLGTTVKTKLNDIQNASSKFNALIQNRASFSARNDFNVKSGNNNVTNNGYNIVNRPLFLSDLLDLLDPASDVSQVFNLLPIAQFKHLPDPSVLIRPSPSPTRGGQYDLSSNLMDETPVETPVEQPLEMSTETAEVMPSLEVEEPIISGGYSKSKSHKWSSHKKRRHTRIRTKKNKKL